MVLVLVIKNKIRTFRVSIEGYGKNIEKSGCLIRYLGVSFLPWCELLSVINRTISRNGKDFGL